MDRWPIQFVNARSAIGWADTYARAPKVQSQMGIILRDGVQAKQLSTMDAYGALITTRRLDDMAETISCTLAEVPAPEGCIYRAVYGEYRETLGLADQLAHLVYDGPAYGRTIGQMRSLALLAIHAYWLQERHGRRMRARQYAHEIGVSLRTYQRHWLRYTKAMAAHISAWLERAEQDFSARLVAKNIL